MRRLCLAACFVAAIACAAAPPEREITVGMTEYVFIPATIEVPAGQRVRIIVRNTGRLEHDFAPDQRGTALGLAHLHLAPGATGSMDWTAPAERVEVRVVCTIAGHEPLGMIARLLVTPRQ